MRWIPAAVIHRLSGVHYRRAVCDLSNNCPDGSDEQNCTCKYNLSLTDIYNVMVSSLPFELLSF